MTAIKHGMSLPRAAAVIAFSCSVVAAITSHSATEWEEVQAAYGNLIHVAGPAGDQNVNSWNESFEGGSALTAELSNPHMTVADAAGNLYIADKESHSILKVTPAGTIHTVAGTHVGGFDGDGPALQVQLNTPATWQVIGTRTSEPASETFYPLPPTAPASRGFYRLRVPR
jgi:hypothetical protein